MSDDLETRRDGARVERPRGRDLEGLAAGVRLGRFVLVRKIGAGGSAVVWEAIDEQLGRRIALKLVRAGSVDAHDALPRLRQEARTMAVLHHPNIAVVHAIEEIDDQLVVAIELMSGNLRQWMEAAPRAWREVVAVFAAAGRGVAAAHRAGIIHRDFKPDNVLRGPSGEVKVADFGLARDVAPPLDGAADARRSLDSVMGTPPYMAPEQILGRQVDARADQFAFCVSMWEALAGRRPFDRPDAPAEIPTFAYYLARMTDRRIEPPARGRRIPAAIERILRRGLEPGRDARFPTMDALLDALERVATRAARRRRVLVAAGVAAAAGLGVALLMRGDRAQIPGCGDQDTALAPAWSAAIRGDLAARLGDEATRTLPFYDRWATTWKRLHAESCRRGNEPAQVARRACLDATRDELAAMLELRTIAAVRHFAIDSAPSRLPAPEVCEVDPRNAPPAPPSPEIADEVRAIRGELATARGAWLERDRTVLRTIDFAALIDRAKRTGYAPLSFEVAELRTIVQTVPRSRDASSCLPFAEAADAANLANAPRIQLQDLLSYAECLRATTGSAAPALARLDAASTRLGHPVLRARAEEEMLIEAMRGARFDEALERVARVKAAYDEHAMREDAARMVVNEAQVRLARDHDQDLDRAAELLRGVLDGDLVPDRDFVLRTLHAVEWRRGDVARLPALPAGGGEPAPTDRATKIDLVVAERGAPIAGAEVAAGIDLTTDGVRLAMPEVREATIVTTGGDGAVALEVSSNAALLVRSGGNVGVADIPDRGGRVVIELEPAAELSGTVAELAGAAPDPADDHARAARRILPVVYAQIELGDSIVTWVVPVDRHGRWRVAGLPAGRFHVTLQARSALEDIHEAYAIADVGAGERREVALALEPAPQVLEVVDPSSNGASLVVAFTDTAPPPPPNDWDGFRAHAHDATRAAFAELAPAPLDGSEHAGKNVGRVSIDHRGWILVCALPGFGARPHMPVMLGYFNELDPPRCAMHNAAAPHERVTLP